MKRFLLIIALISLVSCSGYKIGNLTHPQLKTVAILPIENNSEEPLASFLLTEKMRERFMQDGSLKVVNSDEADIIIKGRLSNYSIVGSGSLKAEDEDIDEASHYSSLLYTVNLTFDYEVKTRNNWNVQKKTVTGSAQFAQFFDLESDKRYAVNLASYEVAKKVVTNITEAW